MSPRTAVTCFNRTRGLTPNLARYERIAPFYDLLDLPFERRRYHALRPLLFQNLEGRLLDAGIGTGRNCAFYPPETIVSGIDTSPAMLARARRRCPTLSAGGRLYRMDGTALEFPAASGTGSRTDCRGIEKRFLYRAGAFGADANGWNGIHPTARACASGGCAIYHSTQGFHEMGCRVQ